MSVEIRSRRKLMAVQVPASLADAGEWVDLAVFLTEVKWTLVRRRPQGGEARWYVQIDGFEAQPGDWIARDGSNLTVVADTAFVQKFEVTGILPAVA